MTTFHLGDILTLILARQLSPSAPGLRAVGELMDHIHGGRVPWAGIPDAMTSAAVHLRLQFPELAALHLPDSANRPEWLAAQVSRFGEQHEVPPIRTDADLVGATKES